jgi:hypothetical protein
VISATAYDQHVEQLFEVLKRVTSALGAAGIEYRVVGGVATFLHVSEKDPLAARMTRDIDMAVDRRDLDRIADAVRPYGFEYRHVAGVDMLVDAAKPSARSAVHLYPEAVPDFSPPVESTEGVLLAPVADFFKATAYLMWTPNAAFECTGAACTIPVPLATLDWSWGADAINTLKNQPDNGSTWMLTGCQTCSNGLAQATTSHPTWQGSINAPNGCQPRPIQ